MSLTFEPFEQEQARAPETIPLPPTYADNHTETAVYWLSASGVLLNSHGTTIMVDPLLSIQSDNPAIGETGELLLTAPPILTTYRNVPRPLFPSVRCCIGALLYERGTSLSVVARASELTIGGT